MACRFLNHSNILAKLCSHAGIPSPVHKFQGVIGHIIKRGLKNGRWYAPYLRELYKRRIEAGPEPERHPSESGCWNYDSELFAFSKRFGEDFDEGLLRKAFISSDYVQAEEENRKQLGIDLSAMPLNIEDNTELASKGQQVASSYIKAYLRHSYPVMLEEGIDAVHDYLMCDEMVNYIASNLGFKDLIMSSEYPPDESMYGAAFKAVIGALAESQGEERAELFVRDFILPQLVGQNVFELWDIVNPMGLLSSVLSTQGRGPPEPRLLWQSASATMMSLYHVGIYSDKQLIGRSPGETVSIAEEMAARDALAKLMNVTVSTTPLQFGEKTSEQKLDYDRKNQSVNDLLNMSHDLQNEKQSISS